MMALAAESVCNGLSVAIPGSGGGGAILKGIGNCALSQCSGSFDLSVILTPGNILDTPMIIGAVIPTCPKPCEDRSITICIVDLNQLVFSEHIKG
jgi:hypothetical protein